MELRAVREGELLDAIETASGVISTNLFNWIVFSVVTTCALICSPTGEHFLEGKAWPKSAYLSALISTATGCSRISLSVNQSTETSPFEVIDHSLKEEAPEKAWADKARRAIMRSEIVIVMVGAKTHKALGVLREVAIACELKKKIVQIIGYKDGNYTAVPNAGRLYAWNWDNLKKLLAQL